jgi:hypothetical protein
MIERADSNNDKVVTMDDFYNIMTKKTFAWTLCAFFVSGSPCLLPNALLFSAPWDVDITVIN